MCSWSAPAHARARPTAGRRRSGRGTSPSWTGATMRRWFSTGTRRNRYMVDRSARLLAVYDGEPKGGTAQTLAYALRKGLHVTILELE